MICAWLAGCAPNPDPTGEQIQGVWQIHEVVDVQAGDTTIDRSPPPSLFIFAERHYSIALRTNAESATTYQTRWRPSDEEKLARYDAITVNVGTWEISDGFLVTRPTVARVAEFVGGVARYDYSVAGDTLWLQMVEEVSHDGVPATWLETRSVRNKLVRVE